MSSSILPCFSLVLGVHLVFGYLQSASCSFPVWQQLHFIGKEGFECQLQLLLSSLSLRHPSVWIRRLGHFSMLYGNVVSGEGKSWAACKTGINLCSLQAKGIPFHSPLSQRPVVCFAMHRVRCIAQKVCSAQEQKCNSSVTGHRALQSSWYWMLQAIGGLPAYVTLDSRIHVQYLGRWYHRILLLCQNESPSGSVMGKLKSSVVLIVSFNVSGWHVHHLNSYRRFWYALWITIFKSSQSYLKPDLFAWEGFCWCLLFPI